MHNNDLKHTLHLAKQWLKGQKVKIAWPAKSPDLFQIEYLWNNLKTNIYKWNKKIIIKELQGYVRNVGFL